MPAAALRITEAGKNLRGGRPAEKSFRAQRRNLEENMKTLTDQQFEEYKRRLYSAVQEICVSIEHLEHDDLEDANNCLMTAQATVEAVNEELAKMGDA